VPEEFETSRKRHLREVQEQADSEQSIRTIQLQNEYEEFCRQQVCIRLESDYADERLENALRDQMKVIKREQPEWFARIPEATRQEVALGRLKSIIKESLSLPTFERWSKRDLQRRLF
jgi:hypothetical protein